MKPTKGAASTQLLHFLQDLTLLLAMALPLLSPCSNRYNVELKNLVLLFTALVAATALVIAYVHRVLKLSRTILFLLALLALLLIIGTMLNPYPLNNAFGIPHTHLGAVELIGSMLIAALLTTLSKQRLAIWLYVSIVFLAITTYPLALVHHSLYRPGGLAAQPVVLAALLGYGWLLGLWLWEKGINRRRLLYASQIIVLLTLGLTQTRACIYLTVLLTLLFIARETTAKRRGILLWGSPMLVLLLMGMLSTSDSRLFNTSYAAASTSYRLDLQEVALSEIAHHPFGYGAGHLQEALSCTYLHAPALAQTCRDGYGFDSSHDVFLDKFLAYGWLAGALILGLTVLALYKGFRERFSPFTYCLLFISLYYLTNVTHLELDLLFWIALLQSSAHETAISGGGTPAATHPTT